MKEITVEEAEMLILKQVKLLNYILEEIREHNKELEEKLGMSYAKLIGLGTPYEEAVSSLRKVKEEFDNYLEIIRAEVKREISKFSRDSQRSFAYKP